MKQTVKKTRVERSGKFEKASFTMEISAFMMDMLSNKMYSNKVRAVLRELACNASDIHTVCGIADKPFYVQLPSSLDPMFKVRDHGTGLTHKEIFTLYNTYGKSTKRGDDKQIGGFGIGSKSPFAYADSFNIVSIVKERANSKQNTKRMYVALKGEDGMPQLNLVHEEKTSEPTGMEISLTVRPGDIETFSAEAAIVFRAFKVRPVITGAKITFVENEVLLSGTNWKIYKQTQDQYGNKNLVPTVRMGQVDYPIPADAIKSAKFDLFRSVPMAIDVEIGTFMPASSREQLDMNPESTKRLELFASKILEDIEAVVCADINSAPNMYEARTKFLALTNDSSPIKHVVEKIKWEYKGVKLEKYITVPSTWEDKNVDGDEKYAGVSLVFREKALQADKTEVIITRYNELSKAQFDPTLYPQVTAYLRDVNLTKEEDFAQYVKENYGLDKYLFVVALDTQDKAQMSEFETFAAHAGLDPATFIKVESLNCPKYVKGMTANDLLLLKAP